MIHFLNQFGDLCAGVFAAAAVVVMFVSTMRMKAKEEDFPQSRAGKSDARWQ